MMIGILLSSFLLILGLIYTFSTIPQTKKFLISHFQSLFNTNHNDSKTSVAKTIKHEQNSKNNGNDTSSTSTNNTRKTDLQLRGVFATFDKNDDGYITKQELKQSLKNIGISAGENDIADMVAKVDANGDGLIDFGEFCELFESISSNNNNDEKQRETEEDEEESLREAFDVFDGNKDGVITVDELGLVLSSLGFTEGKKLEACREMIGKVDIDGDGMVNFHEFKKMMKSGLGSLIQVS